MATLHRVKQQEPPRFSFTVLFGPEFGKPNDGIVYTYKPQEGLVPVKSYSDFYRDLATSYGAEDGTVSFTAESLSRPTL